LSTFPYQLSDSEFLIISEKVLTRNSYSALVALAFSGSIGLLFLFLACALPQFNNWIPFTVVIFYLISPIPTLIAKRRGEDSSGSNPCRELAWFLTTGIVVSAFALPIVLARAPVAVTPAPIPPNSTTTTPPSNTTPDPSGQFTTVIKGGPCFMTLIANGCIFTTLGALFQTFPDNDGWGY